MIRFDDAVPALVRVIDDRLGAPAMDAGVVLRDVTGRLTFVAGTSLAMEAQISLEQALQAALGLYARPGRALVAAAPGDRPPVLLADPSVQLVEVEGRPIRVLDRRLVGADWLRAPADPGPNPPRFVFASIKGGVGRSTALAVTANALATSGMRVLVVDLDIEAPGIGVFLLSDDTTPPFGTIDALVEGKVGPLDAALIADLVAPSRIGQGRVMVCPAFGQRSLDNPENILGKIGRAYGETVDADDAVATPLDQVRVLLERLEAAMGYDAVLIDARAGLHEIAAAALLGLGAEVFLFGQDEPQTFQGYYALLAHLRRFTFGKSEADRDWMERLTPVHAKAPADPEMRTAFADRWRSMVAQTVLKEAHRPLPVATPFEFEELVWDDTQAIEALALRDLSLNEPVAVMMDTQFFAFNPLVRQDQLSEGLIEATFGELLRSVRALLPDGSGAQP